MCVAQTLCLCFGNQESCDWNPETGAVAVIRTIAHGLQPWVSTSRLIREPALAGDRKLFFAR
jgi:hypothetical protein